MRKNGRSYVKNCILVTFACMCHRITSLTALLLKNYSNANLYSNTNKEAFNENIQRAKIKYCKALSTFIYIMKYSILKRLTEIPHHRSINILFFVLNNSVVTKISVTSLKKDPAATSFYLAGQK